MQKEVITPAVVSRALKIYLRELQNDGEPQACMQRALKEVFSSLSKHKGYHRPVCAPCQVEMRPERNGVGVLDIASFGPINLWDADLWQCPKCGHQVAIGFGDNPVSRHYEGDKFKKLIEAYFQESFIIENR